MKAHRRRILSTEASRRSHEHGAPPIFLFIAALSFACVVGIDAQAEERAGLKTGNPLWGIPLADLPITVERPLFSPSRHPPPPPLPASPVIASPLPPPRQAEPPRPPLALLGTVIAERNNIAVLLDETTKQTVRLTIGQNHGGWSLRSVHGRQVDLQKDNRIATLAFEADAANQLAKKPPVDEKPSVDVALSGNPDMEAYRAALHRKRGR